MSGTSTAPIFSSSIAPAKRMHLEGIASKRCDEPISPRWSATHMGFKDQMGIAADG